MWKITHWPAIIVLRLKQFFPFNLSSSDYVFIRIMVVVFNATFNTISVKSWRPVLLVEENGVPGENHWPAASHWQTTMYLYLVTITTSVYSCPLTHRADFLFYILLLCTITIFYFSGTCKCGVGCTGPSSFKCKSDFPGCKWEEHVCIINNTLI